MDKVDMILIMSVNPGFGGQSFIPAALNKLKEARQRIDSSGFDIRLEIDGGVKLDNIFEIASAGADTFVAGSAIFGDEDYCATISAMKSAINQQWPFIPAGLVNLVKHTGLALSFDAANWDIPWTLSTGIQSACFGRHCLFVGEANTEIRPWGAYPYL